MLKFIKTATEIEFINNFCNTIINNNKLFINNKLNDIYKNNNN